MGGWVRESGGSTQRTDSGLGGLLPVPFIVIALSLLRLEEEEKERKTIYGVSCLFWFSLFLFFSFSFSFSWVVVEGRRVFFSFSLSPLYTWGSWSLGDYDTGFSTPSRGEVEGRGGVWGLGRWDDGAFYSLSCSYANSPRARNYLLRSQLGGSCRRELSPL